VALANRTSPRPYEAGAPLLSFDRSSQARPQGQAVWMKASAQKASCAKAKKWLEKEDFLEVCMAETGLATVRPKGM
jgi:hypothetical protein